MEQSNSDTVEALFDAMIGLFQVLKKGIKSNPVSGTISMTLPRIIAKLPKDIESYSWLCSCSNFSALCEGNIRVYQAIERFKEKLNSLYPGRVNSTDYEIVVNIN